MEDSFDFDREATAVAREEILELFENELGVKCKSEVINMSKVVDTFPKNTMEEVRTQITEYKGYKLIDIRVWYKKEGKEPLPTKKGITLNVDLYSKLKEAIDKLGKELNNKKV